MTSLEPLVGPPATLDATTVTLPGRRAGRRGLRRRRPMSDAARPLLRAAGFAVTRGARAPAWRAPSPSLDDDRVVKLLGPPHARRRRPAAHVLRRGRRRRLRPGGPPDPRGRRGRRPGRHRAGAAARGRAAPRRRRRSWSRCWPRSRDVAGAPRHGGAAGARRRARPSTRHRAVRRRRWPTWSSVAPRCWPATSTARAVDGASSPTCAACRRRHPRSCTATSGPATCWSSTAGPPALLDFGYVSTVGDPAFDAAVAAAAAPDARTRRRRRRRPRSTRLTTERFGYDAHRLATYRAAYGLVTASCLVGHPQGAHFRWCLDLVSPADPAQAARRRSQR